MRVKATPLAVIARKFDVKLHADTNWMVRLATISLGSFERAYAAEKAIKVSVTQGIVLAKVWSMVSLLTRMVK